jgi:hypothetical protein
MTFRWFFLALFGALSLSCSVQKTTRNAHQPVLAKPTPTSLNNEECSATFTAALAALCDPSSLTAENASKLLFSPELIHNPVLFHTDSLDAIIWQTNQLVLDSKNNALIDQHVKNILVDCHLNRKDSCKIFHRFAKIYNTHDLFLHQLQTRTSTYKIEDFLVLTDACLITRSPLPLIQEIASRSGELRQDGRLVTLIQNYLSLYNKEIPSLQKKQLLRYINRLDGSYLNLLSKQELIEQIDDLHKELPKNIFQRIQEIRPALARALGLKTPPKDPLFKLLDLVESQKLDLADSQQILLKLVAEPMLVKQVQFYMRWTFAHQLQATNDVAQQIVRNMNVGSNELFERFLNEADQIRKVWGAYKYQQQNFLTSLNRSNLTSTTKSTLRNLTSGLDKTIKMYSEYPHMFYLATYLAQQDFNKRLYIGLTPVEMSSNNIFNEIVNPLRTKLSWFKYTEDYLPLNDLLIRNSLSYIIKSSFFPSMGINTETFLGYFNKNMNSHFAQRHHRRIVSMNSFIEKDGTYPRLKELCGTNKPELKVDFERLRLGFIMSSFSEKTFVDPISVMTADYTGGASGYLPYDRATTPDFYEYAKTDLAYYKRLLDLVDVNLRATGQSSTIVSRSLREIESKRAYAHTSFLKWNEISACQLKLMKEERKIISFVYEKEKEYITSVHQDIKRLRSKISDNEAERIFDKYKGVAGFLLEDLVPLQVQGLDVISTEGYLATPFNFFARTSHYLKSYRGAVRPKVMLPPEIKKSFYYAYRSGSNAHTLKPQLIPFRESPSDFMQYFCGIYFPSLSFTQWLSMTGNALSMSPYLYSQIANLASQHIDIQEYLAVFKNIVEFYKIQPLEKEILGHLNDRSLFSPAVLDDLFLDMNFQSGVYVRKYGLFDVTLAQLMEDVLGYDYYANDYLSQQDITIPAATEKSMRSRMPLRRGPMAEAQIMHDTLRDSTLARLLFGLDPLIVKNEYSALKQALADKQSFIDNFIEAAEREDVSDVRIDIFVDDAIVGPLFSPYILDRFHKKQLEFHQDTSGCFRPDSNCF